MLRNWFKRFLGIDIIEKRFMEVKIDSDVKINKIPEIILLRHQLGSIDLLDVKEEEMTKEERAEFLSKIATFYPTIIKKEIEKMIYEQTQWMAKESENNKQFLFGRGTINGLMLLLERYQKYFQEYQDTIKSSEPYDKTKLFPEI